MASGLQEAEVAFQSMLSGQVPDTQQAEVAEEQDAETEADTSEVLESADAEITTEEEEQEETEQEPEEEYHLVKLDGEDHEATLDELKASFLRQSDYTKKNTGNCRKTQGTGGCPGGNQTGKIKIPAATGKILIRSAASATGGTGLEQPV